MANPIISGSNNQVTIYKGQSVSTAQEGVRQNDPGGVSELNRKLADGWSLTPTFGGASAPQQTGYSYEMGIAQAQALYSFFPEEVTKEFAKQWVKFGDATTSAAAVRNTGAWKKHFDYLEREDGTLIMTELEALSTIASYKETLGEVGIGDTTEFESDFKTLITDEVSAAEFQDRINLVYEGVKEQIPEVERLFRDRYGIESDSGTIFASLIKPDIEDKLLKGEIQTLQLQAEATTRGFSTSFARFAELRKRGFTQEMAKGVYEAGAGIIERAAGIGRDLGIETLEEAALGDVISQKRLQRTEAEILARGGVQLGAAKKGDEVTGLIAD